MFRMIHDMTAPYTALESFLYDRVVADAVVAFEDALLDEVVHGTPADARVLDVGCGGGQAVRALARRKPGWRITGVDLSHAQVARAERRCRDVPQARFVQGSALELPFEDGEFDIVLSVASIKHWPDPDKGMAECARVLASGGKLVVVEADRGCRLEDAERLVRGFKVPRFTRPLALAGFRTWVAGRALDVDEARALLAPLPLEDTRAERIPGTPGLLMVGRKI